MNSGKRSVDHNTHSVTGSDWVDPRAIVCDRQNSQRYFQTVLLLVPSINQILKVECVCKVVYSCKDMIRCGNENELLLLKLTKKTKYLSS